MTPFILLVLLAADLPDPGNPAFPSICGTFGGFVGIAIGTASQLPWERTTRLMAEAGAVGYALGLVAWVVAIAMDRL